MEVEAKKKEEAVQAEAAGDEEEAENQVRLLEPLLKPIDPESLTFNHKYF